MPSVLPIVSIPVVDAQSELIRDVLNFPLYQEAETEYQRVLASGKKKPAWHQLFEGPPNLEQLATRLNRQGMYEIFYRAWSGSVHGREVIMGNLTTFEEHGFKCKAVNSIYYGIFLSYKIERPTSISEEDIRFSLNSISRAVFKLTDFKLVIEEPKLQYLVTNKRDNLERAGILNMSLGELQDHIKIRINTNYIFNLCFLPKMHTIKFNIMLETAQKEGDK